MQPKKAKKIKKMVLNLKIFGNILEKVNFVLMYIKNLEAKVCKHLHYVIFVRLLKKILIFLQFLFSVHLGI